MMLARCPSMSVERMKEGRLEEAGPKMKRSVERENLQMFIFCDFPFIFQMKNFDWLRPHILFGHVFIHKEGEFWNFEC